MSFKGRVIPEISVEPKRRISYAGTKTTFACKIKSGIPSPTLVWVNEDGYRVPKSYVKIIKDGIVLKFRRLYRGHSGNYSCISHNVVGRVQRSVQLTVKGL